MSTRTYKKLISGLLIILCVCYTIHLSEICAVAVGVNGFAVQAASGSIKQGSMGTVTIPIRITGLPNAATDIGGLAIDFHFDPDVLTLEVSASSDPDEVIMFFAGALVKNASDMIAITNQVSNGKLGYNFSNTGLRRINKSLIESVGDTYAILKFKLKENAEPGVYPISMTASAALNAPDGSDIISMDDMQSILAAGSGAITVLEGDKIVSVETLAPISRKAGKSWGTIVQTFPQTVNAQANYPILSGSTTGSLPVVWGSEPPMYGQGVPGTYYVTGTVIAPQGVRFAYPALAGIQLELTILNSVITAVAPPSDVSLYGQPDFSSVISQLPSKITVTVDGVQEAIHAEWDGASYNKLITTPQVLPYKASALPYGYLLGSGVQLPSITVTVYPLELVTVAPDFGKSYGETSKVLIVARLSGTDNGTKKVTVNGTELLYNSLRQKYIGLLSTQTDYVSGSLVNIQIHGSSPTTFMYGDVNNDNLINNSDLLAFKLNQLDGREFVTIVASDLNGDGLKPNNSDLLLLKNQQALPATFTFPVTLK